MEKHVSDISDVWLLASDLDGTLIPTPGMANAAAAIRKFGGIAASRRFGLAYVTGRHLDLAVRGVKRFALPWPDAIAADVGTSIYHRRQGGFLPDSEYEDFVATLPGTPAAEEIRGAATRIPGLRLQENDKQARFKVSFYYEPPFTEEALVAIEDALAEVGETRLERSRDPVTGVGLLDVLPAGVGKETAVRFLSERQPGGAARVVFAGDSGNDREALLAGWRAIVVGNAPESLKRELRNLASERGIAEHVFFAGSSCAEGVIEGLRHHGLPGVG